MLQIINKYLNENFEIQTSQSMDSILKSVDKVVREYDWVIKSRPPIITENEIQIQRTPSTFAPFRGLGTIKLTLSGNSGQTNIKCDIYPYNNSFLYILMLGIGLMGIWTLVGLFISTSMDTLLVLGIAWTGAIITTTISVLINKRKLKYYSKGILKALVNKTSR